MAVGESLENFYELLSVPKNASTNEIRTAYRRRAMEEHPDKGGDPELFQTITTAYDVLSDPERRKYYDRTGRQERSVEEDFLEGFGRDSGASLRKAAQAEAAATAQDNNSQALQQRISDVAGVDGDSSASFEAWMRARNTSKMTLTTEDLLMDKANIVEGSYEKVKLPKMKCAAVVKRQRVEYSDSSVHTLAAVAAATEVSFERIPKYVDWKECLINITAAAITPLDAFIAKYGTETLFRDDLQLKAPHVMGCSGVGIVEVVGPGCRGIEVGDWVLPIRDGLGTFCTLSVWDDKDFIKVPKEIMPVEYMALHRELVMAYYLMETVAADLKAGDALVVNAANGAVGQLVIQLARMMKLRAIAIVRRHDNHEDTKAWLEFLGAAKVFADDEAVLPALQKDYASLPKLGLDGVGGLGALKLIRSLAPGSTVVSYGYSGERNVPIPWQIIVHSRVTIRGFDVLSWLAEDPPANRKKMIVMLESLAKLVNGGKLRVSMEEAGLEDWSEALAQTAPGNNTKMVLKMRTMDAERMREQERAKEIASRKRAEEGVLAEARAKAAALFVMPPPDLPTSLERCYELPAQERQIGTLIWVHGNGELPHEYSQIFNKCLRGRLPGVRVLMPSPPASDRKCKDPQLWFDLDEQRWLSLYLRDPAALTRECTEGDLELMKQVEEAADYIAAIVEQCDGQVALAGFSHGAVVALYAAMTKLSRPLASCVLIGATPLMPQLLKQRVKPHLAATPTCFISGSNDPTLADQKNVADNFLKSTHLTVPDGHRDFVGDAEIRLLADDLLMNLKL